MAQNTNLEWSRLPLRLLSVDDGSDVADSLVMMLTLWGHDAVAAYDGPSALKLADHFHPDIVFADLAMPGMDGYAFAEQLRAQPANAETVVVAATAHGDARHRDRARSGGFDLYFVKPFDLVAMQALLDVFRRVRSQLADEAGRALTPAQRHRALVRQTLELLRQYKDLQPESQRLLHLEP
jgi:CheY-like chemotaxis protein